MCTPNSTLRRWANAAVSVVIILTSGVNHTAEAVTTFADGQTHYLNTTINDTFNLKSSSSLTLPEGNYVIRAPKGSESAIRLTMSSTLNVNGGDIIGCDAAAAVGNAESTTPAGVGIIVGSASKAEFYNGATVRGGNHLGAGTLSAKLASDYFSREYLQKDPEEFYRSNIGGIGGDALIGQYFGTKIKIHGGNFIAGRGSASDGNSLRLSYDAQAEIYGGDYKGAWLAVDGGTIAAYGCFTSVGNRLVGKFHDGTPLDVQVIERSGGSVKAYENSPGEPDGKKCAKSYHYKSSAAQVYLNFVWFMMIGFWTLM